MNWNIIFYINLMKYKQIIFQSISCDYYPDKNYRNFNSIFYINNCYFFRTHTYNGYGGIIYFYNMIVDLKISDCIFFNCSSNSQGGAIRIHCNTVGSKSEFIRNCGYDCFASDQYQFALIAFHWTNPNNASFISVSFCGRENNGRISFGIQGGNINLNNFNSSKNNNIDISGVSIGDPTFFNGKFWTIINNTVINQTIIRLSNYIVQNNIHKLSFSNIINNNIITVGRIISVYNNAKYDISDCIFKLINEEIHLIFLYSGFINIFDCKINSLNFSNLVNNNITLNNNEIISTSTFSIDHLKLLMCIGNKKIIDTKKITCQYLPFRLNSIILMSFSFFIG